ncbi:zinc ABC transporter substrate-binding protein [Holzapfeliella sp. He02]|uniref:Zinc ABC transporter substrate-binding protein n=1 Tax=Holzapfeliella saturejae TaxID=3082953 RepID=A0ABU8SGL7_9LACO
MKKIFATIVLALAAVVFVGCQSQSQQSTITSGSDSEKAINVITSTDVYSDIVSEITQGTSANVTPIISGSSADPHHFEPTANDAKKITNADLIVENGLGYDSWFEKLVKSTDTKAQKISIATDIGQLKDGDNEHIWYDVSLMKKFVETTTQKLIEIDSANQATYEKNAQAYLKKFDTLTAKIDDVKSHLSDANKKVNVSEPVADYLLQQIGFEINNKHFEQAIAEETDPSAQDIAQMQKDFESKTVSFFVYNTQSHSPLADQMADKAKAANLPILEVTETKPNNTSYIDWMTDVVDHISKLMN